jgi:hypothetical protein
MADTDRLWRRLWARRWLRRTVIGATSTLAAVALVGFLVVPPIARRVAQKQLGEMLGRKVAITKIRLNPFALSLAVEGFQIYEVDGVTPFLGFGRLYVNAQLSSVFRRAPVVKEIALESPRVRIVRVKATTDAWADVGAAYNFSDIVARLAATPKSPEPAEPPAPAPPRFSLNNLHLAGGAVTFDDAVAGDHHEISELTIGVPFASTLPVYLDSFVEPGLSVRVDGTPFVVGGRTKPFKDSLETSLELRLQSLDLTRYLPFVPLALPFAVESARLSLALDLGFVRPRVDAPRLTVKGRIALDALDVREKRRSGPAPLLKLGLLEILIGESDLTAQRFTVDRILVSGLELHVRRQADGSLNLEHLAPAEPTGAAPKPTVADAPRPAKPLKPARPAQAPSANGPRFAVGRFTLEKSTVHFRDETTTPAFSTEVRDVAVAVTGLSNAPGATAKTAIGLRAVPGGTVTQQGTLRLSPVQATGSVEIEGIEPARFAPYSKDKIAFDVASGRVRVGTHYAFEQAGAAPKLQLSGGFLEIAELALRRRDARDDFFRLGSLAVKGAAVDLDARKLTVAEVTTRDGRVRAARDAKGVVDLTTLVAPAPATVASAPAPAARPAAPTAAEPAWTVALDRFALDRWGARFDDRGVKPATVVTVDPISVHASNVSTARGAKLGFDVKLAVNKKGRLQASGTAVLDPLAADVRFDLSGLEIVPLQPYFRDQVSLLVTGGAVSVKGHAGFKAGVGANVEPKLNVGLDLEVADLATVDAARQEPLIDWKSFRVAGLKFTSPPVGLAIDEVALTDFHTRVVMFSEEHMNLADAFAPPGAKPAPGKAPAAAAAKPAPPKPAETAPAANAPKITVGRVVLQGGNVSYTDRVIKPSYTAELTDLTARLSGLSSVPGTTADIELSGTIDRSGALAVGGKLNPLAKDLFADVQVSVRGFELPPTSPYSGRFVGLAISKGKLDLALDYKIAARKLDAKNKLVLDQFTFGDKIASPDAVNLPVRLAVSLLKDRKGVIDIDLPIAGSLDDPEFKVWRAVAKVLRNLVVKAATAPFSLIASAFGGGEELSRIDFQPGTAALDATANKRLGTLAKVLLERPGLSFEIVGGADPAQDREGVRRESYERKLKTAKMTEMVRGGAAVASADVLVIAPGERAAFIDSVYDGEKFAKPKNAIGLEKSLPPADKEKLILANTKVEDDELRALALRRATVVQAALAKAAPGAGARLFLVSPRLGGGGRQVELKLRKD